MPSLAVPGPRSSALPLSALRSLDTNEPTAALADTACGVGVGVAPPDMDGRDNVRDMPGPDGGRAAGANDAAPPMAVPCPPLGVVATPMPLPRCTFDSRREREGEEEVATAEVGRVDGTEDEEEEEATGTGLTALGTAGCAAGGPVSTVALSAACAACIAAPCMASGHVALMSSPTAFFRPRRVR